MTDAVLALDARGTVAHANRAAETLFGVAAPEIVGRDVRELLCEPRTGTGGLARHADGSTIIVDIRTCDLGGGRPGLILTPSRQRPTTDVAATLADVLEARGDIFLLADPEGTVVYASKALEEALAVSADETDVPDVERILTAESWNRIRLEVIPTVRYGNAWSGELTVSVAHGELPVTASIRAHDNGAGEIALYSMIAHDISELKQTQARLAHQATHDPLTGLPNRSLFHHHLSEALARRPSRAARVAVLFLDLDRFKLVNDSLGHEAGDTLLRLVAEQLRGSVRESDFVARFGGDEFCVLCPGVRNEAEAREVAHRISESLEQSFWVRDQAVHVGVSIGIALDNGITGPDDIIRNADVAAYRAKELGRSRIVAFDDRMQAEDAYRLQTENELRQALRRNELRCAYQPIVDLLGGQIVGFEALLRWDHPTRGVVDPGEFVAIAEDTGLIIPIGIRVLDEATRQAVAWEKLNAPSCHMSVNLSARQLGSPDLAGTVRSVLEATGLAPARLWLEVTESTLMDDVAAAASVLGELKELGLSIAIDDFGTGQSSLNYLRQFPVDVVKIDRSFVEQLGVDRAGTTIVASVVNLAHALGLTVVAEGVETMEQLASLHALGCDLVQGYYFSRPVAVPAATDLLVQGIVTPAGATNDPPLLV